VPAKEESSLPVPLRYQERGGLTGAARSGELMRLKLRYKDPKGSRSRSLEWTARDEPVSLSEASADFRFAAAVAAFGMLLRESPHKGAATFDDVRTLAEAAKGQDAGGYRQEFVHLVGKARALRQAEEAAPEVGSERRH
jgi:Ca-activated chloride channel homolog